LRWLTHHPSGAFAPDALGALTQAILRLSAGPVGQFPGNLQ
jgi:hypothetical protein